MLIGNNPWIEMVCLLVLLPIIVVSYWRYLYRLRRYNKRKNIGRFTYVDKIKIGEYL